MNMENSEIKDSAHAPTTKYDQERQSSISVQLIVGIIILVILFLNVTHNTEDEKLFQVPVISGIVTLLLGFYVFIYRGKGHVAGKVLFIISLIITAILIGGLIFIIGLGQAFQH